MKKLTISTKITLAYFLLSAALLAILIPSVYFLVENSLRDSLSGSMQLSATAIEGAMFEKDGEVYVNEAAIGDDDIKQGVYVLVTDSDENVIYESMNADVIFDFAEYNNGKIVADDDWSFFRKTETVGNRQVNVNVLGSIYFNDFLADFVWSLLFLVPGYLLLAVIGAKLLAWRALRPVRQITETAKGISEGDLSKRIEGIQSRDEVGELADMFNRMIIALEHSFQRERQFTSDASHELRTPMTVINACTEDALSTGDSEIREENLRMIQKENERMTKMLSQLLMLSRGYEGRYRFQPEELDLCDTAESVTESMSVMADARSIRIHNQVTDATYIKADQSLLTQLLVNLVENAIKYGKEGGNVWIYTEDVINDNPDNSDIGRSGRKTRNAAKGNNDSNASIGGSTVIHGSNGSSDCNSSSTWALCIRDDGVGISAEDLPYIFERFYRADKARNRSGSGLGLSIAKWIVTLHGWEITAESQLGEGTTMVITGF